MADDAKRTASAILALAPPGDDSSPGRGSPDALLADDRGITAQEDQPTMEVSAQDAALTAAARDFLTATKTGDVETLKSALEQAILAVHPRYAPED